ncbi:MAG TPA: NRDE family protein [Candidatus Binatia bacterium]
MCTLAIYFRAFDDFPLIIAANRDEHYDRPSAPPSLLHTTPKIISGRDLRAGGTWLGCNERGLVVAILNRHSNDGPPVLPSARSRGALCMDLLMQNSISDVTAFLVEHRVRYNPFTLLFADPRAAYVAHNEGQAILTHKLETGLHVFSSAADFELHSNKARRAEALFAEVKDRMPLLACDLPASITALQAVLADHSLPAESTNPGDAICVHRENSGTVSSSIVFFSQPKSRFDSYYCEGPPCRNRFGDALGLDLS